MAGPPLHPAPRRPGRRSLSKWLGFATGFEGGSGFVILKSGGKLTTFTVGDEISPGRKLQGIFADRIRIERDGTTEEIRLPVASLSGIVPSGGEDAPQTLRPEVPPQDPEQAARAASTKPKKTDADEPPLKRFSALLLAATLAMPVAAQTAADGDTVSLNFANAEIEAVIKAIGKITGRNFLIDPRVKAISTSPPIRQWRKVLPTTSCSRRCVCRATPRSSPRASPRSYPRPTPKLHAVPVASGKGRNTGAGIVTQVFTLQNESAAQMVPVIRPLISPNNTVSAYPSNNALVVTDYADNVERIARIIASVDVPQGDLQVIELKHAAAADIAGTLAKLLTGAPESRCLVLRPTRQ